MLTKNWYKILAGTMTYESVTCKSMSGADYSYAAYNNYGLQLGRAQTSDSKFCANMTRVLTSIDNSLCGVIFGTGTTAPTIDDYKLSGDLFTTISYNYAIEKNNDDAGREVTVLYTITNTGDADVTIGEVAIVLTHGDNGASCKVMLERTVLDEPVTIPAGGVGQVTYTIRMDYPTE